MNCDLFVGDCRYITMQTKRVYTVRKYRKENEFCIWMIFIVLILTPFYCNALIISPWMTGANNFQIRRSVGLFAPLRKCNMSHPYTGLAWNVSCDAFELLSVVTPKVKPLGQSFRLHDMDFVPTRRKRMGLNNWRLHCVPVNIPSDTPCKKFCTSWFANAEQWMMLCGLCQTLR